MRAVIAGGGIGGLSVAIALALRGWTVQVLEQAPALTEVGAGLQIAPNGWRVLKAMGVTPLIADTLFEPEMIEMRDGVSGRRIFSLPMRDHARARWGGPYIQIHRADLVDALATRLQALAPGAVETGRTVARHDQRPDGVTLVLEDGRRVDADLVVAADGLHSVLRRQMIGADQPRYTGNLAWRAVVPVDALGDHAPPNGGCIWVGDRRHAVTTRLRAGALANFVGMVEQPEPAPEGWRIIGDRDQARAHFDGWHPMVTTLIERAEALHRWALFDRAPLPRWHEGRVALLGDAAHPMLPSMAQGAVQAIEDAWVLAGCVTGADPARGLQRYFDLRQPRTARVQAGSAANARLFHHGSALGRIAVYGPMAVGATLFPGLVHRRQDWVYGHDATAEVPPLT